MTTNHTTDLDAFKAAGFLPEVESRLWPIWQLAWETRGKQDVDELTRLRAEITELRAEREALWDDRARLMAEREAMAKQEPVAWRWRWNGGDEPDVFAFSTTPIKSDKHRTVEPLFASPVPIPEGYALVQKVPTQALLRPFYECPPDELPLAWDAMLVIAASMNREPT